MKRSFYYFAAGVLALSACTSDEVLCEGIQSNAIGFRNVVDKQSRVDNGQDITTANLEHFNVFGYYLNPNVTTQGVLVFNNVAVTKSIVGDQVKWNYDDTRYWVPGGEYYFYAYSCGNVSKLSSRYGSFAMDVNQSMENDRALKIIDYVCDDTHQHDLLFASKTKIKPATTTNENGTPEVAENNDVAFKFSHILAKIDTKFTSEFPTEYIVEVKNVKASNIRNFGDYAPSKDWYGQERQPMKYYDGNGEVVNTVETPYVMIHGSNVITACKGGQLTAVDGSVEIIDKQEPKSESAFVIPYTYTGAEVELSFEITVKAKDAAGDYQTVLGRVLTGKWTPKWESGHWYTYTIKITGDASNLKPIVFTTDTDPITGWSTGETLTDIQFSAN